MARTGLVYVRPEREWRSAMSDQPSRVTGQSYEFEMSEADHVALLDACAPVPMIMLQCGSPMSPQECANAAWASLGEKMGFDSMGVEPIRGKSTRFFTAVAKAVSA